MKNLVRSFILFVILFTILPACDNPLQEETFSEISPNNFFRNADDAETALNGVYENLILRDLTVIILSFQEVTTDIMIQRGGGLFGIINPLEEFSFPSNSPWVDLWWDLWYQGINRANTILDQVPDIEMDEARKEEILAEARFLRALKYYFLYDFFGPVPIVLNSQIPVDDRPSRPSEDEFIDFLENELLTASEVLPETQDEFPRATRGAAQGILAKFYLNNKMWEEAAQIAGQVINSNVYSLLQQGDSRAELFALENEGNREMIFVIPFSGVFGGLANSYFNVAVPPGYQFKFPPKVNFAANMMVRSEFLELFEPEDERMEAFIFEYLNVNGETVPLEEDNVRSFKYPEDPTSSGSAGGGNDLPIIRYADILLTRAEALNEINGPNTESISLINQVRSAAGVDEVNQNDFTQTTLRDFILDERGREFHTEGLRRQDLIRHGKFIEKAQERGKPAQDFHVRFPLPQQELDKNSNLTQNPGY